MKNPRPLFIFLHIPKTGGTTLNVHLAKHLKFDEEYVHIGSWGHDYRKKNGLTDWFSRPQEVKDRAKFLSGHGVYYGIHKHVRNVKPYYILIVRDPMKRVVSGYHFTMSENLLKGKDPIDIVSYYDQIGVDPTGLGNIRMRNITNRFIWRMNRNPFLNLLNKSRFFTSVIRRFNHIFLFKVPVRISLCYDRLKHYVQYRRAKQLVDKCWFVCDTKDLNKHLPLLFQKVGVPKNFENYRVNDSEKNIDDPEVLLDQRKLTKLPIKDEDLNTFETRFSKENDFDYKLYNYIIQKRVTFENNLKN